MKDKIKQDKEKEDKEKHEAQVKELDKFAQGFLDSLNSVPKKDQY